MRQMERAGAGIFMGAFHVGDMPHANVMRNIELFADKVMPHLPLKPVPGPIAPSSASRGEAQERAT